MWRNIIRHLLDIPWLWQHEHFCRVWKLHCIFFLHFRELQRVLTSKKGAGEHEAWGEGGTGTQLCEGCIYFCTCTSCSTWTCHGVKCTLWTASACRSSDLNSNYSSTNPSPSQHSHVLASAMEANSTNRQQCLAEVEGKLVREVKVNNIPCCIQQARNCLFCVSKEEEENKGGQLSNP